MFQLTADEALTISDFLVNKSPVTPGSRRIMHGLCIEVLDWTKFRQLRDALGAYVGDECAGARAAGT